MGVYIKGIEMPTSCPCKLIGVGYDLYCSFTSGIPSRMREYSECCEKETRPDWCPLGDVPAPHGDLIDKKAISDDLQRRWNVSDDQDFCNKEVWNALEEAPTIIEAEE